MHVYTKQTFCDIFDRPGVFSRHGNCYQDISFEDCRFENCTLSIARNPRRRTRVRNVSLVRCRQFHCSIDSAILEEVMIEGLKCRSNLLLWDPVFKHVTLRGEIGALVLNRCISPGSHGTKQQQAFDRANAEYYSQVDWAIDIRDALFKELAFSGVPSHLVRRDPETQVVLTREKALERRWETIDFQSEYWPFVIQKFIHDNEQDSVLIAPKRAPNFNQLVDDLELLRRARVVEAD